MSEIDDITHVEDFDSRVAATNSVLSRLHISNTEPIMTAKLEADVLKSISLVGYEGCLVSENEFKTALQDGPKSIEFTKLINYLTNELRGVCNIDEHVNAISTPEDSATFIMEISSFLKELGCPYPSLTKGHVSERLSTVLERLLLIQHLVGELMAIRILKESKPDKKIELKLNESSQAADLRKILQTLGFPKPPANITMQSLLQKLIPSVQNTVQKAGSELLGCPIFNGTLSEKQWETLANVQQELHEDYRIRREMLLKRLDCTIQSFQWSDKTKGKEGLFNQAYTEKRKALTVEPEVDLSDLLASREDLAIIEKTSSAAVRKNTKSAINKIIIGQVPDRGGRTSEQAPPPPEMPPWQQRQSAQGGGGAGFRGGSQRGSSSYSRGGGQQSNYGGGGQQSNYGGGNNYSQGRGSQNYNKDSRGGGGQRNFDSSGSYGTEGSRNDYNNSSRGSSNYSQKSDDYNRGSNDYKDYSRSSSGYSQGNDYSRSSNDYSGGGYSQGSSGGYSHSDRGYSQGSGGGYSQGSSGGYSRDSGSSRDSGGYSQGGGRGAFDSAGGYGGYNQEYQEPKRAKTFDQFQQNKTTYADQYVQESQHNQQYHSRDNRNRGNRGGRSNYNRGRGGY